MAFYHCVCVTSLRALTFFGGGAGDTGKVLVHVLLLRRELPIAGCQQPGQRAGEAPVHKGLVNVLLTCLPCIGTQLQGTFPVIQRPCFPKYSPVIISLCMNPHHAWPQPGLAGFSQPLLMADW